MDNSKSPQPNDENDPPVPERMKLICELLMSPQAQAAFGIAAWSTHVGDADLPTLVHDLKSDAAAVSAGDQRKVEAMLLAQAEMLQVMFGHLAQRAAKQELMPNFQTLFAMALKAQSQCRATLEALSEIRSPRQVAFVRQANIAGAQQVNNVPTRSNRSRARKSQMPKNELLELPSGKRLDPITASTAVRFDSPVEATDADDRAKVGRR